MSLEKAIKHGKEKRKPYYGAKAVSGSCARGDCPWCKGNKLHKHKRRAQDNVSHSDQCTE